jgi:Zn-dependent protease with chaperone function
MTHISRVVFFGLSLNFAAFCGQHPTCPASFLLDPLVNELGTELACPEVCDFVAAIQKELGLENHCIEVRKFSPQAIEKEKTVAMVMGRHHLFVYESLFLSLTQEEQRFIIGHELIHLRNKHVDKTLASAALSGFATMAAGIQSVYALEKLCLVSTSLCPLLYTASIVAGVYASVYTYGAISRYYEKEADMCAAKELKCADGGMVLFKRPIKSNLVKNNKDGATQKVDPLALYKKAFDELVRTHPNRAERVAYLQKLSQVAPAA